MMYYSSFAYQTGLVDFHAKNEMRIFEILAQENIRKSEGKVVSECVLVKGKKN